MRLIQGIHHYSMKCTPEELPGVLHFYHEVLGMSIVRTWEAGVLLDSGGGLIEVFSNGEGDRSRGAIRHIAFAVEDADACAKAVMAGGYEVFLGPKDIQVPFRARIAFCFGPLGEEVEFFQQMDA